MINSALINTIINDLNIDTCSLPARFRSPFSLEYKDGELPTLRNGSVISKEKFVETLVNTYTNLPDHNLSKKDIGWSIIDSILINDNIVNTNIINWINTIIEQLDIMFGFVFATKCERYDGAFCLIYVDSPLSAIGHVLGKCKNLLDKKFYIPDHGKWIDTTTITFNDPHALFEFIVTCFSIVSKGQGSKINRNYIQQHVIKVMLNLDITTDEIVNDIVETSEHPVEVQATLLGIDCKLKTNCFGLLRDGMLIRLIQIQNVSIELIQSLVRQFASGNARAYLDNDNKEIIYIEFNDNFVDYDNLKRLLVDVLNGGLIVSQQQLDIGNEITAVRCIDGQKVVKSVHLHDENHYMEFVYKCCNEFSLCNTDYYIMTNDTITNEIVFDYWYNALFNRTMSVRESFDKSATKLFK